MSPHVLAEIAKRHDDPRIREAARRALIELIIEREGLLCSPRSAS